MIFEQINKVGCQSSYHKDLWENPWAEASIVRMYVNGEQVYIDEYGDESYDNGSNKQKKVHAWWLN